MASPTLIESALEGDISTSLFKDSPSTELIKDWPRILLALGFKCKLKFDSYQVEGDFGPATTRTVAAFATKHKIESNGKLVTNSLAELMLQRLSFLPEMYLLWSIHISDLRTRKFISKGTRISISAIPLMLHERGYGELLIRPLFDLLLRDINAFYGGNWSVLAVDNLPAENSPLISFRSSRFMGKPCQADVQFEPMLHTIPRLAGRVNVFIHVNSSFSTSSAVAGTIVKPTTRSKHRIGHALDMNVVYNNRAEFADSKVPGRYPNVPEPVRRFIKSIKDDPDFRWGGDLNERDPVHADDGPNRDMGLCEEKGLAMQRTVHMGFELRLATYKI